MDKFSWDELEQLTLPHGREQEFEILELKETRTQKGVVAVQAIFNVVGGDYDGAREFQKYTLGSEQDPEAATPATRKASVGGRELRRLLVAAEAPLVVNAQGVNFIEQIAPALAAATGHHFKATPASRVDPSGVERSNLRHLRSIHDRRPLAAAATGQAPSPGKNPYAQASS